LNAKSHAVGWSGFRRVEYDGSPKSPATSNSPEGETMGWQADCRTFLSVNPYACNYG
jgi:hypothetical protein